jgi:hypothetical protein
MDLGRVDAPCFFAAGVVAFLGGPSTEVIDDDRRHGGAASEGGVEISQLCLDVDRVTVRIGEILCEVGPSVEGGLSLVGREPGHAPRDRTSPRRRRRGRGREAIVLVELEPDVLTLGPALDPSAFDLLAVAPPLRGGQRVVERVERRVLQAGVRARMTPRDPEADVVRALRQQLAEQRLALLRGARLQEVLGSHLARDEPLPATRLERLRLQSGRQLILVILSRGYSELVVQVAERHRELRATTGEAIELLLRLTQRRGIDIRLQDRVGDRHCAIVDPAAAALVSTARSLRRIRYFWGEWGAHAMLP